MDKIIAFYSPKSNCDGSKLQYSNRLPTIIMRNFTKLNRALYKYYDKNDKQL